MPFSQENCDRRHRPIKWTLTMMASLLVAFPAVAVWSGYVGYGAIHKTNGIDSRMREYIAKDERGDEAIQNSLERIEAAQIRMDDRMDMFLKLAEE